MFLSYNELKQYVQEKILKYKKEIEEDMYISSLKWDKDFHITEEIYPQKIKIKANLFSIFGFYYQNGKITKRKVNLKNKKIFPTKEKAQLYFNERLQEYKQQINNKIFLLKEQVNTLERKFKNNQI